MTGTRTAATQGIGDLFAHDFMRHALLSGTGIACAAGLVGWFLVLRMQSFASDALSHVAYTGALGALAVGVSAQFGLIALTVVAALALAALGNRARADDVVIGSTFAWLLGLSTYFLASYTRHRSNGNGLTSVHYLFGSIYGLSTGQAWLAAGLGLGIGGATLLIARPLLFASIDGAAAAASGVRVRLLDAVFLVLVGLTTAGATQAIGALLILGLLTAPAAAAHRLTQNPYAGMGLSTVLALGSIWGGLLFAHLVPDVPPSFGILAVATGGYLLSTVLPLRQGGRSGVSRVRLRTGHASAPLPGDLD